MKCLLQVIIYDDGKFFLYPIWLLFKAQEVAKVNKNVSSTEYNGSFDCARQLYKKGGIQNLYRGAVITVARG